MPLEEYQTEETANPVGKAAEKTIAWCKEEGVTDSERAGEKMAEFLSEHGIEVDEDGEHEIPDSYILDEIKKQMVNQEHYLK